MTDTYYHSTGRFGGARRADGDTMDGVGNGKYKRKHTVQKTSETCSIKAQKLASPSLKKQTRKALLHKPMFLKLGKDLPIDLASPLG